MIEHVTPIDGNVFLDIGFPPGEAENLLVRSRLFSAVQDLTAGMPQHEPAGLLGIT